MEEVIKSYKGFEKGILERRRLGVQGIYDGAR